jgi:hypothetical protein
MLFELATGLPPWPDYPDAYEVNGYVHFDCETLRPWLPAEYPAELCDAIVSLLHVLPEKRPALKEVYDLLLGLRHVAWGLGEQRWPTDVSATDIWVCARTVHGTFGQVPVPASASVMILRDYAVSRVMPGM